jgi:hypothetical protein
MPSNTTFQKRQKERARLDKQREKDTKRKQRRDERPVRAAGEGDLDPDIAGIVPGPQPIAEDQ